MAYNGAGSLFALGIRLTRLGPSGAPLVGADNAYQTDALVQMQFGLEYEEGEEIIQRNGSGRICLTYKAPDSLKRATITGLQFCTPDPNVLAFLIGGEVLEDGDGNQIGYRAPEVGSEPTPDGVSLELWTRQIIDGAFAGYNRWVFPRIFVRPSGDWTASGSDPLIPEFEGFGTQNPNWGDGPLNDWDFESDRVWQYVQTDDNPIEGAEFVTVLSELTVTSVAVTPATANLDLSNAQTQQLQVIATMSDASTRDVTHWAATSYVSAAPATCTVDSEGLVTPVAVGGPVNVTATYGAQSDVCAVTVVA
jgi:hypothetical protein